MKNFFLTGKNLYLRPLLEQDLEGDYVQWLNDPEVCKYNSHYKFPYTQNKALEYIKKYEYSDKDLVLAIILIKNNSHIGNISLQNINYLDRNAKFTIIIGHKKSWGKGYSKEAARLIINHGFLELNLHRIYCGTSIDNIPMQKLAQSLGMINEGCRRKAIFKNGEYHDILEYGLIADEYFNKEKNIKGVKK